MKSSNRLSDRDRQHLLGAEANRVPERLRVADPDHVEHADTDAVVGDAVPPPDERGSLFLREERPLSVGLEPSLASSRRRSAPFLPAGRSAQPGQSSTSPVLTIRRRSSLGGAAIWRPSTTFLAPLLRSLPEDGRGLGSVRDRSADSRFAPSSLVPSAPRFSSFRPSVRSTFCDLTTWAGAAGPWENLACWPERNLLHQRALFSGLSPALRASWLGLGRDLGPRTWPLGA